MTRKIYKKANFINKYTRDGKTYRTLSYVDKGIVKYIGIRIDPTKKSIKKVGNDVHITYIKKPKVPKRPSKTKLELLKAQNEIEMLKAKIGVLRNQLFGKKPKKKPVVPPKPKKRGLKTLEDTGFVYRPYRQQMVNMLKINFKPEPVTESTVDYLAKLIYKKIQAINIPNVFTGGYSLHVKLLFIDLDHGRQIKSIVFKDKPSRKQILDRINRLARGTYNTENYILHFNSIEVLVVPFSTKGGCSDNIKKDKINFDENNCIILESPKTKNNNCLFGVYNKYFNQTGNSLKPDNIRKELGIPLNEKIGIELIDKIHNYYLEKLNRGDGYQVVNQDNKIIAMKGNDINQMIKIYLRNEHYYLMHFKYKKKCFKCGRIYWNKHTCSKNMVHKYNLRVKKMISKQDIEEKKEINYNNVINYDLETFVGPDKKLIPYACGWLHNGNYHMTYGKNCMNDFVDYLMNQKNIILNAFNGSRFDHYFLIDTLVNKNINVDNIILSNGRVVSFNFGSKNKCFDLCLFINSSLDKACGAFQTKIVKGSFEHTKIKNWDCVEQYKSEWEPYLETDVRSLTELFQKFNHAIYEVAKVNITKYVTLSHMGYNIWMSLLDKNEIEIPDLEKYKFIKQATFGGRTYPHCKEFKSEKYVDIRTKKLNYNDVIKSGDFIFNADATSLYPASMVGFEHCKVEYPTGRSRWSDKPMEEFNNNKIGFYEVNYIPPKDITVAMLPRRKENGGVSWSLEDGTGVYTSVDIKNAISVGYKIEFVNKCLVYDDTGKVFDEYINEFYKMKEEAVKNGNKVKKSIAKLLLNSLYGKTLQRAIFNTTEIVNDINQFNKFIVNHVVTDWIFLNDNRLIISGDVKDANGKVTKPSQLGAFVTGYSRTVMMTYMKAVDPELKKICFTYTDTDSLHLRGSDYFKLKEKGMIVDEDKSKLGFLCSDIDDEGVIIHEKNLGPKSYHYTYINNKNEIGSTNKTKGIPKKLLKNNMFLKEQTKTVDMECLKKINKRISKQQQGKGITPFSIVQENNTRTFNKNTWNGMLFNAEKQIWLPLGYNGNLA